MRCPYCSSDDSQVKDSRPAEEGSSIRRRRTCNTCSQRFTTFERVQLKELVVIKSDQRRQPFERDKLERSLRVALRKRRIAPDKFDQVISGFQRALEMEFDNEISAREIGKRVLDMLLELDQVAYVRYASVYKDFGEVQDFAQLLHDITQKQDG